MSHSFAIADAEGDLPWSWPAGTTAGPRGRLAEILTQVSREALQGDSFETVLQRTVDCLARHLPIAVASICLLNQERSQVVQEVRAGIDRDVPLQLPRPVALGAQRRGVSTGRSQLVADVALDADYALRSGRIKSEFMVPLRHRGDLLGWLNLESTFTHFFTPGMCEMFEAVGLQVAGAVHLARALNRLEMDNSHLKQLSLSDGLTGVANRRSFDQSLEREWAAHEHSGESMALLLVDVDCFKAFNDALGHPGGDECLRVLAQTLTRVASGARVHLSRYGGEEFVLLLAGADLADARRLADALRSAVEQLALHHPNSPVARYVTVSIGVSAARPEPTSRPQSLLISADRALYAAKKAGRNCVVAAA